MRLLVTGACGFVGRAIIESLREPSFGRFDIVGLDNLSRKGSWLNREKLEDLGVRVLHGDIRFASDLQNLGRCDWVIDAAANPSVLAGVDGKSSSRQLVEHNLLGTVNLLELCKEQRSGLILLSTSRVYSIEALAGLPVIARSDKFVLEGTAELPEGVSPKGITESCTTSAPISLYGASKVASEQLALEYSETFGFPVWVNRCGVLAGAGQFGRADQGIFSYWLHSWREGRDLRYIGFGGKGFQVRDCLHPRDLVSLLLAQLDEPAESCKPRIVNASGGMASATSLAQLSSWCESRWGSKEVLVGRAERPFDLPWIVLDHSLATDHWDWTPQTSVNDILTEIADFADQNPEWLKVTG